MCEIFSKKKKDYVWERLLLSWPPSLSTACTKLRWSSGVQRSRGTFDLTYCLTVVLLAFPSLDELLLFSLLLLLLLELLPYFLSSFFSTATVVSSPSSSTLASSFKSNNEHFLDENGLNFSLARRSSVWSRFRWSRKFTNRLLQYWQEKPKKKKKKNWCECVKLPYTWIIIYTVHILITQILYSLETQVLWCRTKEYLNQSKKLSKGKTFRCVQMKIGKRTAFRLSTYIQDVQGLFKHIN